jgi:pyruvate dehydrogenase E1 component
MVEHMSDEDIVKLPRGGHDYRKVYSAFDAATKHVGQPTVILAHTIKGWTIDALEGKNATHQMKKLTNKDLKAMRDRLYLPITDKEIDESEVAPFYHPGQDSPEIEYMLERRRQLGGSLPERRNRSTLLTLPGDKMYAELKQGSGKQAIATTMALVRLLRDLMRDKEIGHRIVPIAPDEYRTFGMDGMFPTAKVYNPMGQRYESVDRNMLLAYKESAQGQLLHEGISEAGAVASATAAGSAYSTHGEHMIPFYLFYSMFGFQRTGDSIWAMADQLARGFLIGATAGRTTLTGEGLQHADGHSPLLAATNPAVVHYDPATAYEISYIVQDALRRMYGATEEHPEGESVIYYLTVYNEPTIQPAEPENLDVEGLLRGIYHVSVPPPVSGTDNPPRVQLLASGVGLPWVTDAAKMLAEDWGVAADTWSVTSWNELARDGVAAEEWNLLHPSEPARVPYVTDKLKEAEGPVIAVSDFMRAVPNQIAKWIPGDYHALGADGFGFADTRPAARRFFHIDAPSVVVQALRALALRGEVKFEVVQEAFDRYRIDDPTAVRGVKQEGGDA